MLIHARYLPGENDLPCENHIAFGTPNVDEEVDRLSNLGFSVDYEAADYDRGRSVSQRSGWTAGGIVTNERINTSEKIKIKDNPDKNSYLIFGALHLGMNQPTSILEADIHYHKSRSTLHLET